MGNIYDKDAEMRYKLIGALVNKFNEFKTFDELAGFLKGLTKQKVKEFVKESLQLQKASVKKVSDELDEVELEINKL